MGKYFRGWRRKAGVLVLGIALALTGGWVRSSFIADGLLMISKGRPMIGVLSIDHYIGFAVSKSEIEIGWPVWASRLGDTFDEQFGDKVLWRRFCFAYAETIDDTIWFAPYWSIVIPLTLLSAYLLLSKPRVARVSSDQ